MWLLVFAGGRTAQAIVDEALKTLKNTVNARLGGKVCYLYELFWS